MTSVGIPGPVVDHITPRNLTNHHLPITCMISATVFCIFSFSCAIMNCSSTYEYITELGAGVTLSSDHLRLWAMTGLIMYPYGSLKTWYCVLCQVNVVYFLLYGCSGMPKSMLANLQLPVILILLS